ncbi:MAG: zf-HC2 domain-containing protein [Defluviitaleaceae bacterium]|nr:zf-HC2 domain-containing protein [Defluviitaleaceae bacterium]
MFKTDFSKDSKDSKSDCMIINNLMTKYMDTNGTLSKEEREQLDIHLYDCADCAEEFAAYGEVLQGFGELDIEIMDFDIPKDFEQIVMAQINELNIYKKNDEIPKTTKIIDNILFVAFGFVALLFSVATPLTIYRHEVDAVLLNNGYDALAAFISPITFGIADFAENVLGSLSVALTWITQTITEFRTAFFVLFLVLAAAQFFISPRYLKWRKTRKVL